ncbi:MAG: UDP-N-acetylmuramoyl-L-alanine--D-glutamate ligase [Rickettsiaceae bacterium H1]|nr:UDP-N-acetylmuramoyl-L-alanine--D-glutamate ligase [Rickettsiaceae bacterium H1]
MIVLPGYSKKNIAVFGLGITGISVINALKRSEANVFAWDDNDIPKIDGVNFAHPSNYDWSKIDELILSPGISLTYPEPHEIVLMAQKSGCPISCDIDLLYKARAQAKFIGITGTNGKSTTASLIHHILIKSGIKASLGGNIGVPVLELPDDSYVYVLEISSYQLDLCKKINFDIGVLLNITPDHLDRHGNMENYINAKAKILGNISVIGIDYEIGKNIYEKHNKEKIMFSTELILSQGFSFVNEKIYRDGVLVSSINRCEIISENFVAAYTVCSLMQIPNKEIVDAATIFENLPHRMEFVGKINNVTFINDSKATNGISAGQALNKYKNIYWIAGGIPKAGGITEIDLTNVKKAFLIGRATDEFADVLAASNYRCVKSVTLENAINQASEEAFASKENITLLFSPACSSFDQWKNFVERGLAFKRLVKEIIF